MKVSESIIKKTIEWLGEDGRKLFQGYKDKYGKVNAMFMNGKIPHSVHFREGIIIRNFLRSLEECKNWTDNDFDDNWVEVIEKVIE